MSVRGARRTAILAVGAALAVCTPRRPAPAITIYDTTKDTRPCRLVEMARLPLVRAGDHLFVPVAINGQVAMLMLDTGGARTLLTPAGASRLGLVHEKDDVEVLTGIGGKRSLARFRAQSFRLGHIMAFSWPMLVADIGWPQADHAPDGILGDDVLWRYDLDVDLAGKTASLYSPLHDCSTPSAFMHGPLYQVPLLAGNWEAFVKKAPLVTRIAPELRSAFDNSPRVAVAIGVVHVNAVVDTGAPRTMLFRDGAAKLGLRGAAPAGVPPGRAGGIGPATVSARPELIATLVLGDLAIDRIPVQVVDQAGIGQADMILGLDVIGKVHIWVSHSSNALIVQFPPEPGQRQAAPPAT